MPKPKSASEYDPVVTANCERVLVTLLRGLGPYKDSVYLVGGLTPRYLVSDLPAGRTKHAGTGDVDIVVELGMLAPTKAYHTLEQNMKNMGFERAENDQGQKVAWRWRAKTEQGVSIILELLADDPARSGGKVMALPSEGNISALNIPHSSMVFDHHLTKEITAALLGGRGQATETVRYADLVCFTCLKAFALDQRYEPKDAHDFVFCIENCDSEQAVKDFRAARQGKHGQTVKDALAILKKRFCDDAVGKGYLKDGSIAVAAFEIEGDDEDARDRRVLRQRQASDAVSALLKAIGE